MIQTCEICGFIGSRKIRNYRYGDTWSYQGKEIYAYKTFHCKNCGFFSYDKDNYIQREKISTHDWDNASNGRSPYHDPDHKKWIKEQGNPIIIKYEELSVNNGKGRQGHGCHTLHRNTSTKAEEQL